MFELSQTNAIDTDFVILKYEPNWSISNFEITLTRCRPYWIELMSSWWSSTSLQPGVQWAAEFFLTQPHLIVTDWAVCLYSSQFIKTLEIQSESGWGSLLDVVCSISPYVSCLHLHCKNYPIKAKIQRKKRKLNESVMLVWLITEVYVQYDQSITLIFWDELDMMLCLVLWSCLVINSFSIWHDVMWYGTSTVYP